MENLFNELEKKRIELWIEHGQLYYKAPKGAMTKEIAEKVKSEKSQIIKYLNAEVCSKLERIAGSHKNIKNAKAKWDKEREKLILYVNPQNGTKNGIMYNFEKIASECADSWFMQTKNLDRDLLKEWIMAAEEVALEEMFKLFLDNEIFVTTEMYYTYSMIEEKLDISDKYKRFLRRWLKIFEKEGYIIANGDNYKRSKLVFTDVASKWEKYWAIENKLNYGEGFVKYLEKCSKNLQKLFCGKVTPLELLFPHGEVNVAVDTYQNTLSSKILNHMAEDAILAAYNGKGVEDDVFRILEVGAGVGGTSDGVIEKISGKKVEYYYTDVSNFFLNNAKERYKGKEWITYKIFDINQGDSENDDTKFDLILCANVLHNAKNGIDVLTMLKSKLKEEGIMTIIDAVKEPYYLLTSIEFNDGLRDFDDFRQEDDGTFFDKSQWEYMFDKVDGKIIAAYPEQDDKFFGLGQGIFVVYFNNVKIDLAETEVHEYIKLYAKAHELPDEIRIVSNLNKEIMKKNKETIVQTIAAHNEKPFDEVEIMLESIWCNVLNKKSIGRNENFYMIGGDSLLVSQVIAQMWEKIPETKEWEWGQLMRHMLATPTIAGISENIVKKHKKIEKYTTLIEGTGESNNIYVLFHAGTGSLAPYIDMINELRKNNFKHKVIGISCDNQEEYLNIPPENLYSSLGEKYANILKQFEEYKLYFIGHCIGGIIALETAKILLSRKMQLENVTMISTNIYQGNISPQYLEAYTSDIILEKVFGRLVGADIEKAGYVIDDQTLKCAIEKVISTNSFEFFEKSLGNLIGDLGEIGETYSELLKKSHMERLNDIYRFRTKDMLDVEPEQSGIVYNVFKHNFIAAVYYKPSSYAGKITILKCDTETENFFVNTIDNFSEEENVWNDCLIGNINVSVVQGNHMTCMEQSNIIKNIELIIEGI